MATVATVAAASPAAASAAGAAKVDDEYDPSAAARRAVTVGNLARGVTLAQVDALFRGAGLEVDITYRRGQRAAAVVFKEAAACRAALSLSGAELAPASSAKLPASAITVTLGLVEEPKPPVNNKISAAASSSSSSSSPPPSSSASSSSGAAAAST